MSLFRTLWAVIAIAASSHALAVNQGKITRIYFSGAAYTTHPNVVQLEIEGGFSAGSCNTTYAGVRKGDDHIISFLLTAYTTDIPIIVSLDTNDRYYADRCVIITATSAPR